MEASPKLKVLLVSKPVKPKTNGKKKLERNRKSPKSKCRKSRN
jgi:hypothetical protein